MKPNFKLGERVLVQRPDGTEYLATVNRVLICEDKMGIAVTYTDDQMTEFPQRDVVGRVNVQTVRKRNRKKKETAQLEIPTITTMGDHDVSPTTVN